MKHRRALSGFRSCDLDLDQLTFIYEVDLAIPICHSCSKPETVTHFLTDHPYSKTYSAVLAACNGLKLGSTIDIVLSDNRLHNVIVSSLDRKI